MARLTPHRPRALAVAMAGIVLALLPAGARADTFTAPELFIARAVPGIGTRGTNPWIPLARARMHSAGSYRLGARVEDTSDTLHREYLTVQSWTLPQGRPVGTAAGPCARVSGTPGEIADWGGLEYAGTGTYRLRAGMTAYVSGPCPTGGPASDDTFTVDARSVVHIVGAPRAHDRGRRGFRGVRSTDAVDTLLPQVVCARSPRVQPDGSLRGSRVTRSVNDAFREQDAFPTSGRWGCVARAMGTQDIFTAWSTPVFRTIYGLFDVVDTRVSDPTAPSFVVRLSTGDPNAAGGRVTLPLRSCRRGTRGRRVRRVTLRARVDRHGDATLRFHLPHRKGEFPTHYVGRARFSGTRLVGRATAPGFLSFYDVNDLFEGHIVQVFPEKRC